MSIIVIPFLFDVCLSLIPLISRNSVLHRAAYYECITELVLIEQKLLSALFKRTFVYPWP